ncbi:MAG: insulinase family protein [Alphaproteobacteria bacterium]|nr:insulinase family protein [Alphaproteobacteria bacterium]
MMNLLNRSVAVFSSALVAAAFAVAISPVTSHAAKVKLEKKKMDIQHVTSPGGITAWLVEEHSVPLIAMRFAFEGGSAQDLEGKEGVANLLTTMLDEGAGDLDASAFQDRMEDIAMRLNFSDGRDSFYGNFQTLTENRDAATDLLRLALTEPRFDDAAVDRMRKQLISSLSFAEKNPNQVASKLWAAIAFPNHPYGRAAKGTPETVASITPDDLRTYHKRVFAKSNLKVAVVGDITAAELGGLLDKVFGGLSEKPKLTEVAVTRPAAGTTKVVDLPVPQSVAVFGFEGLARKDPDFIPAYVLNHILGGGGFSSKLMEEVREKRGLAYSVYSYLQPYDRAAIFAGSVATQNEKLGESLDVIRAEIAQMATEGPSAEDLESAKSYLTGSYALRFDTSDKIASQLLAIQKENLGIDYVNTRNDKILEVTLDDIKRVAKRLLKPDDMIVAVAGQPQGVLARN